MALPVTTDPIRQTAADVFGWPALRPGQREGVEALLAGRDTLVVLPTGAGKSAVYQLAALLRAGRGRRGGRQLPGTRA